MGLAQWIGERFGLTVAQRDDGRYLQFGARSALAERSIRGAIASHPTGATNRHFKAAGINRLTVGLPTSPLAADDLVRRHSRTLRARSRYEYDNNDYAGKIISIYDDNVVGPRGFTIQAQVKYADGTADHGANWAIENAWRRWCRPGAADITRQFSFVQMTKIHLLSALVDGDAITRKHRGLAIGKWAFALESIDCELLDPSNSRQLRNGNWVRMGIEYDDLSRPVAYWLIKPEPSIGLLSYGYAGRTYIRVPVEQIIHQFDIRKAGQSRGLPHLSRGLLRMTNLDGAEDAVLVAFRVGAAKLGWLKDDGTGSGYLGEDQGLDGGDDDGEEDGQGVLDRVVDADIGSFGELPPGVTLERWEPPFPNGEVAPFIKGNLRGMGAGANVPYESLANDREGVNYSSIRAGLLEARDNFRRWQEWLAEGFVRPVFESWLEAQLLAGNLVTPNGGRLDPLKIDKYREVLIQPHTWDWVDPLKEVQADAMAVEHGQASLTEIVRKRGRDFAEVVDERKKEIEMLLAAGVPLPPKLNEQLVAATIKEGAGA